MFFHETLREQQHAHKSQNVCQKLKTRFKHILRSFNVPTSLSLSLFLIVLIFHISESSQNRSYENKLYSTIGLFIDVSLTPIIVYVVIWYQYLWSKIYEKWRTMSNGSKCTGSNDSK